MSKRYIDAEPLKSEIENTYLDGDSAINYRADADGDTLIGKFQVLDIIYDQPTADVQEVKHGKWIFTDHYGYYHTPIYECSNCKKMVEDNYIHIHKYCLHCGAKMDEKE